MKLKTKLTLWYTLLFAGLLAVVLTFLVSVGGKLLFQNAESLLRTQTQEMAEEIEWEDGRLELDDDFRSTAKGVQFAVYQKSEPVAGQLPKDLDATEPLQAGILHRVGAYLVYDLPIQDTIVLRGCYFTDALTESNHGIFLVALLAAPLLLLLAALGGWSLTKKAFAPIDSIAQTAAAIESGGDLTARIRLPNTGDEVSALGAAFDAMLDRLEASFQAEKQFSSDVSHELRTPVAVIQSQCEYALSGVDAATMQQSLQEIEAKTRDISTLIARLLELSRAEHSASALQLEPVDLSELMHLVAEELDEAATEKHLALSVDTQDGLFVAGEQTLLLRLLLNLTENAIKYTPSGGQIRLSAARETGGVVLRVQDNGIGIPKADLPKLFDRFYRVDPSRHRNEGEPNQGYGLGLAFCKWIATVHHATLTAESTLGQGSVFTAIFPLASAQDTTSGDSI